MPGLGDKTQHTLDELVQNSGQSGSQQAQWSELEFLRQQTIALQEASAAAKETAEHTKRNATYMLCSVIALALAVHSAYGPNHRAECREVMGKFVGMAIPFSLIV